MSKKSEDTKKTSEGKGKTERKCQKAKVKHQTISKAKPKQKENVKSQRQNTKRQKLNANTENAKRLKENQHLKRQNRKTIANSKDQTQRKCQKAK